MMTTLGYVYFISEGGAVKIGFANNVASRLSSLQTGNRRRLTVEMAFPAHQEAEKILHRHFQADRISGEWFRMTPDIEELWDDIFDYQGSRAGTGNPDAPAKELLARLDNVVVETDDLLLILENLGKPWPELTCPRQSVRLHK